MIRPKIAYVYHPGTARCELMKTKPDCGPDQLTNVRYTNSAHNCFIKDCSQPTILFSTLLSPIR